MIKIKTIRENPFFNKSDSGWNVKEDLKNYLNDIFTRIKNDMSSQEQGFLKSSSSEFKSIDHEIYNREITENGKKHKEKLCTAHQITYVLYSTQKPSVSVSINSNAILKRNDSHSKNLYHSMSITSMYSKKELDEKNKELITETLNSQEKLEDALKKYTFRN